jgi:hypothetical protein
MESLFNPEVKTKLLPIDFSKDQINGYLDVAVETVTRDKGSYAGLPVSELIYTFTQQEYPERGRSFRVFGVHPVNSTTKQAKSADEIKNEYRRILAQVTVLTSAYKAAPSYSTNIVDFQRVLSEIVAEITDAPTAVELAAINTKLFNAIVDVFAFGKKNALDIVGGKRQAIQIAFNIYAKNKVTNKYVKLSEIDKYNVKDIVPNVELPMSVKWTGAETGWVVDNTAWAVPASAISRVPSTSKTYRTMMDVIEAARKEAFSDSVKASGKLGSTIVQDAPVTVDSEEGLPF